MSGQWEVVSGKKKTKIDNQKNKIAGIKTKKTENLNVKLEDVLTKSQFKNLYNEKNKEKIVVDSTKKSAEKKAPIKKNDRLLMESSQKPKTTKSIESALNSINCIEFNDVFEKFRIQFSDAPIVWLKELLQYLNQRLPVEVYDPVFTTKPLDYPLRIVPKEIVSTIQNAVEAAGDLNTRLFFDIALALLTTELNNNLPAFGHRIFLQFIAQKKRLITNQNLGKYILLRNSHQNRPNIGLAILWSVGQAGLDNFQLGFEIFQELMLPLLEMKNYSRFCIKYLLDIVENASENDCMTKEQFFVIIEIIYGNKRNFPIDLKSELMLAFNKSKLLLLNDTKKQLTNSYKSLEYFFQKLPQFSDNKVLGLCIFDVIVQISNLDVSSKHWNQLCSENEEATLLFLRVWVNNISFAKKHQSASSVSRILHEIEQIGNQAEVKVRKINIRKEMTTLALEIRKNMASKNVSSSSSRWYLWVLVIGLSFLVYLDVKHEGSWQKSKTCKGLVDSGLNAYIDKGVEYARVGLKWSDEQLDELFPGYWKSINDIAAPYALLLQKLGKIACNVAGNVKEVIVEKYPKVIKSIESYAPDLVEHSQATVINAWSTSILYYNRSIDYLKTEVFIGQLSPENMQRVVFDALNNTQVKATEYYHWLYEKVQTTIK